MRRGGSKQKGAAFEREVCEALSLWVTAGVKEDCFWRSAMSGGRATLGHRKGRDLRQGGDITAVAPEGHSLTDSWYIECKHVKTLDLQGFILGGTGKLAEFWRKAKEEATRHQRDPMIIARQNHYATIVITKSAHATHWVPPIVKVTARRRTCDIYLFSDLIRSTYAYAQE